MIVTSVAAAACAGPDAWFQERSAELGVDFTYVTGGAGQLYLPEVMGGGVAVFDFDDDGDLDLYFVNGAPSLPGAERGGDVVNRLFRREPDGQYVDVTAASGLGDSGYGMGVAVGDVDNDGWADVYVANLGPDQLYRNRGDGSFENVTAAAGIDVGGWSASAAFCDYDRDGWLDLYVTRYVRWDPAVLCRSITGEVDYCGPKSFSPEPDVLLHNAGDGRFGDVSGAAGILGGASAGLGVVCRDVDADGWPDFYVANDGYANTLWINRHDGRFDNQAVQTGVAFDLRGQSQAGMGVLADDLDGDGLEDFFVTNLRDESNTLYRGQPGWAVFLDETAARGLGAPSLPFTGFGVAALDLELDGDLDLAIANGRVTRGAPLPGAIPAPPWDALAEPNLLHVNRGDGQFDSAGPEICGPLCGQVEITRGLASGDLDGDGDVDLVAVNLEGPARVYENIAPRAGRWLGVRAVDPRYRRDAIGAVVTVEAGGRSWRRTVATATSYLTSVDPTVHFGLGEVDAVDRVAVAWPDGLVESFDISCVDCAVTLVRGSGVAAAPR